MVRGLLNLLHREVRGLHQAAYLLGFFALLSTLLALVRDRLLAHSFGAGEVLDIYYAAFRIPDIIFVSVASMVSLYVLIPFLTEDRSGDGSEQRELIGGVLFLFSLFISAISIAVFVLVPFLMPKLFPGLAASSLSGELVTLTRILLLQPILLGLSNVFASVTQLYGRFILYATAPLVYNVGIIIGVLFLYPAFGIYGLGYGVVIGALAHMGIQIPFLLKKGFFSRIGMHLRLSRIRDIVVLSLPRTVALSANHLALLVLIGMASLLAEGSITIFNFSFNLQAAPLSIIGASYSVAAFPTLARLFSNGDRGTFLANMLVAARHIIFWSTPVIVLFIVLRAQIVRVVLGSGAFDWADTRLTAAALALFSVSLVAQGLTLLFVRGYYAAGNTKKPLLINLLSAALIIAFSYGLVALFAAFPIWRYFIESLLRVEDLSGTALLMLPLGFSLAAWVNVGIFWVLFQRDFPQFSSSMTRVVFEILSASVAMGFVIRQFLTVFADLFDINTFWGIFAQGFFAGIIGILAGILVLKLLKNREIEEVTDSLHRKFWKTATIGSQESEL